MRKRMMAGLLTAALMGCSTNNTQSLQDHTADATAAAKRDAGAIARGVAEGLTRKGPVNINTASDGQLEKLPGVTPEIAGAIIAKRPYAAAKDLLRKHAVTAAEYKRIKSQVITE